MKISLDLEEYCSKQIHRLSKSVAADLVYWAKRPDVRNARLSAQPRMGIELHLIRRRSEMAQINLRYRKKQGPTDVLSFESPPEFLKRGGTALYLGELLICLPVARAQAREQGHPLIDELEVLLVHGVLHLLGWDHEKSQAQANEMKKREIGLLKLLANRKTGNQRSSRKGLITRSG